MSFDLIMISTMGVFDNDDADVGEGYVCMTLNDLWVPPKEQYNNGNMILSSGVFDINDNPSIHPNYFNITLNSSLGHPYVKDNPISNTKVLHYTLIKSSMKKGVM